MKKYITKVTIGRGVDGKLYTRGFLNDELICSYRGNSASIAKKVSEEIRAQVTLLKFQNFTIA